MLANTPKQKPRSPTLAAVFDNFIGALKADPQVGELTAARIKALIDGGASLKPESFEEAIFPSEEAKNSAEA